MRAGPTLICLLPLLIAACKLLDPLDGLPSLPFDQSGVPVLQLDRLPGRFELPKGNLPHDAAVSDRFALPTFARGSGDVWIAPLPFTVRRGMPALPPPGLTVHLGDEELRWDASLGTDRAWRVHEDELHVRARQRPEGLTIVNAKAREQLDRLEHARSGLPPEQFVRYTLVGPQTREGLLLPAPASASFDVRLPESPSVHFTANVAMVDVPTRVSRSGGADVSLIVISGGEQTEVSTIGVPRPGAEGLPMRADLSPWAGRDVTLRLETRPGLDAVHDYVFVAAPTVAGEPSAAPRRVVVIAVDTLRPDHLGSYGYERPTSPELDAFAGESVVFERAWAPAPRTRPSFRTALTGRWPLEAMGAPSLGAVFDRNGFATAGIVANVHLTPRFRFHEGYDLWWLDPGAKADEQVDRGLAWLEANRDRDTFLFLHVVDPHLPYIAPRPYGDRFVSDSDPDLPVHFNRWQVYNWARSGKLSPRRKAHIEALYDGEIAWTSTQIGRFLAGLDKLGGNTLVVFHTDHGEEMWEHGGFEHNHTLHEEVVRAALWFRVPGATPARTPVPATLADIAPTLYDYLDFEDVPPSDGVSLRPWIDGERADAPSRPLPVGYLRYDRETWGVVLDGHKYTIDTASGTERLYDLSNDPEETTDVAALRDLEPWRRALGEVHGMSVGPGWRIQVRVRAALPLSFALPAKAIEAGVIDPESLSSRPANQAWGQKPRRTPDQIGSVQLSDDGRTLVFTPGAQPNGTLYVRFDAAQAPAPELRRAGRALAVAVASPSRGVWQHGSERVSIEAGTVVVPPPSEAARMRALAEGTPEASDAELELLESLGYISE